MSRFRIRSVGARLALALFLVLVGALAVVYLLVVPRLEQRLVDAKLSQLERAAPGLVRQIQSRDLFTEDFMDNAADTTGSRVVIYQLIPPETLVVFADSRQRASSEDVAGDEVARRAARSGRLERGVVEREGERFAEVAVFLQEGPAVLLLSAPLRDAFESVNFVERQLVLAGLLALLVALAAGYAVARLFAARLRRLQQAAERIAGGSFDEPVVDTGGDELGDLARAFDRMRERLAGLDHARREFIANASHELRTPLFSLGGHLELLTEEDLDEATRSEFVETMREQVERLTKLAGELLDLSRLDAGRLRVERAPVDLSRVGRLLLAEFGSLARRREHVLELHAEEGTAALADEQRVLQIGRALVENALSHSPPGATVRVRVSGGDGRAQLAVEDDGPGIPREHAEHIFERFYRVDGTLASGSGLGLAIARELAELMGGSLELTSESGTTVFTLSLPEATPDEEAAPELERVST